MINKNFFLFLFPIFALVYIYAIHADLQMLSYLTKPLMVSMLCIYFYLSVKNNFNKFSGYILFALSSSALGDYLVVKSQGDVLSSYFMWGLIFFFISHIIYIFAFSVAPNKKKKGPLQRHPRWIILFVILQTFTLVFLWPDIPGNLRIPITIYSIAMVFMILAMLSLKDQIHTKAFSRIALGTVLFILSDILISIIRFKIDQFYVPQPRIAVVVTYLSGHYFIMTGSLELLNSNIKSN